MRTWLCCALAVATLATGNAPRAFAQSNSPVAPDNTKTNQGDRSAGAPTADQQKENATDRQTSAKIRSALIQDKSLSTDARNIKIITQDGSVTLKGPVRTQDEKDSIEATATSIAGQGHVTDQLEVAPRKQ